MLIANPIPIADALDSAEIEAHISAAVADAAREKIGGKALTPFLLQRMFERTKGRSLTANIALVENNARVAAQIADGTGGARRAFEDPAGMMIAGRRRPSWRLKLRPPRSAYSSSAM